MRVPQQRPLSIFLFFLSVFSGCTYALDVHSHRLTSTLAQFIVWCPGAAALCTCLLLRIPLGTLGWSWPPRRSLSLAYFLPLLYATPVYLLTWLFVRGSFTLKSFEVSMVEPYGLNHWPPSGRLAWRCRCCLPSALSSKRCGRSARNSDGAGSCFPGCSSGSASTAPA